MVKEKENAVIPAKDRAKSIHTFMKFGRSFPNFQKVVTSTIHFKNLFDMQDVLMKKLDFTDIDKTIEWVDIALADLDIARIVYKSHKGLALYHLSQGIEKLLKACLIYTGFKKEVKVITMNHKPQMFVNELLNDRDFEMLLFEKSPIKGLQLPKKPSDDKLEKLKSVIATKDKVKALNDGDIFVQQIATLIGRPSLLTYSPEEFGNETKKLLEKMIPKKELKRFIGKCNSGKVKYDDMVYEVSNYCYIVFNMVLALIPLSIGTWAFQYIPRYPDEVRLLGEKKFEDYHAYTAFYAIIDKVEKFGECFKEYLEK